MGSLLAHCRSPRNLKRATITAMIVGPILTLINQTPVLAAALSGKAIPSIALIRIALTFVVPFVVSLVSAALADRHREGG